jgi:hypothetical protein
LQETLAGEGGERVTSSVSISPPGISAIIDCEQPILAANSQKRERVVEVEVFILSFVLRFSLCLARFVRNPQALPGTLKDVTFIGHTGIQHSSVSASTL